MKQLLILSGKGGTGKTTIAAAFIYLAKAKAYADCDVDAPNLHLIANTSQDAKLQDYYGLGKAQVNNDMCVLCGVCKEYCRYDSISIIDKCIIDSFSCEGCGVYARICPASAITMIDTITGELKLYKSDFIFSTAQLKMGSGNSGKLVYEVKKQLINESQDVRYAIIDGSPGIGCPVIASLSGVDMTLIVAEPSISGISDMERIIKTARKFNVLIAVCVNKYDINIDNTKRIEEYCIREKIPFVGKAPYDKNVEIALNKGINIAEMDCPSSQAIKIIYNNVNDILLNNN